MTASYPVHLRLSGRRVLVVGAGRVATRKIERLVESGALVRVVAPHASAPIRKLAESGALTLTTRDVHPEDAEGAFLLIAATDSAETNAAVAQAGRERGALVSRVDDASDCDFTIPALARGRYVEATISTGGLAPAASRRLAKELRTWIERGVDRFAGELAHVRKLLSGRAEASARLRSLGEGELFMACVEGDERRVRELVSHALGELGESA
jgi:precorrin-2 dehydrogenase/sirohydrochlorin ferrochelatase